MGHKSTRKPLDELMKEDQDVDFNIRGMPYGLRQKLKMMSAQTGLSMTELAIRAIEKEVSRKCPNIQQ